VTTEDSSPLFHLTVESVSTRFLGCIAASAEFLFAAFREGGVTVFVSQTRGTSKKNFSLHVEFV
jgi:hypothetical protein